MSCEDSVRRIRKVLGIPLDELYKQFETNTRQDVKIIIPEMLTSKLYDLLVSRGEDVKPEQILEGRYWTHSPQEEPNRVCEAASFIDPELPQYAQGPFALSFVNEKAPQDVHYHTRHWEIYYSEKPLAAMFRYLEETKCRSLSLPHGGVMIIGPGVAHRVELGGMTMVLEVPSVSVDKEYAELEPTCEEYE